MSSQTVQWTTMPSTSHYKTATIPNSYPPVIIGGDDLQGIPTAGIAMLKQSWSTVASLSSPRLGVAVVPINSEFILIVEGTKGGKSIPEYKTRSITTAQKGTVKQLHTTDAILHKTLQHELSSNACTNHNYWYNAETIIISLKNLPKCQTKSNLT